MNHKPPLNAANVEYDHRLVCLVRRCRGRGNPRQEDHGCDYREALVALHAISYDCRRHVGNGVGLPGPLNKTILI